MKFQATHGEDCSVVEDEGGGYVCTVDYGLNPEDARERAELIADSLTTVNIFRTLLREGKTLDPALGKLREEEALAKARQ